MINNTQLAAIILFLVLGIGIPCLLPILIHKRYLRLKALPVFIGAGAFILFAMVLESLLHLYVLKVNSTTIKLLENPWLYALYGCLAAALFEETGRLLAFKILLKKYRSPSDGIAYGLGHGGIEFILIGGLGAINILIMAIMINRNTFDNLFIGKPIEPDKVIEIKNSILDLGFTNVLLGLFERCMAVLLQLGMSMIVFYGIVTKKIQYYFFAMLLHITADFPAALSQKGVVSPKWIVELILIPFAIGALYIAIKLFKKLKQRDQESSPTSPSTQTQSQSV